MDEIGLRALCCLPLNIEANTVRGVSVDWALGGLTKTVRHQRQVNLHPKSKVCTLCGRKRELQRAHLIARSRGGGITAPLCYDCHRRWDKGNATDSDLRKMGITRFQYTHYRPRKRKRRGKGRLLKNPVDEMLKSSARSLRGI